jgi:transposase
VAGGHGGRGERADDGPGAGPTEAAAQKKSLRAAEQDAAARAAWRDELPTWTTPVVFLDETSTHTSLTRRRARAPRGQRVVGTVPRNHGPNVTCLAALSRAGIVAPCVFEGALDGPLFAAWVARWLVPALRPGTMVVCDNLSVHKHSAARAALEAADCTLRFLPAYSPDLNPIELAFAKLKAHLRGAGARSFPDLVAAIGTGLARISSHDAYVFFAHAGYPSMPTSEQAL